MKNIRMNIKADGGDGEVTLDISAEGLHLSVQQGGQGRASPPPEGQAQAARKKAGRPKGSRNKRALLATQPAGPAGLLGHRHEAERNGAPGE